MIKMKYACDGGSLCLGTVGARVQIPNNWGDGEYTFYLYDACERVPEDAEFKGCIEGEHIQVYDYDGYDTDELLDPNTIIVELCGRFGIYAVKNSGDMILQRWA